MLVIWDMIHQYREWDESMAEKRRTANTPDLVFSSCCASNRPHHHNCNLYLYHWTSDPNLYHLCPYKFDAHWCPFLYFQVHFLPLLQTTFVPRAISLVKLRSLSVAVSDLLSYRCGLCQIDGVDSYIDVDCVKSSLSPCSSFLFPFSDCPMWKSDIWSWHLFF